MSARGSKDARLVLGASPRVDLLPPEVADRKKGAALRRAISMGVVGAVVVSAGAYAFASWQSIQAGMALADAQSTTTTLLNEQAAFSEVRALSAQRDLVTAGRQVGAIGEIDWSLFYAELAATLPPGAAIDRIEIVTNSPIREFAAPIVPTHGPRSAEATLVLVSRDLGSVATWLATLKSLPGYGDATATPARAVSDGYETSILLSVTDARFTKRFAPAEEPPAEPPTAETAQDEGAN